MRYTLKFKPYLLIGVICLMMVFGASAAWGELKAGTVINADNIDEMKPQEFEGKTIASMLPEKIEWWIRNHGLNITLRHSEPYPVNPRWIEATNKYWKDVKFDPKTRIVTGYKAGMALPNITDDDPYKACKMMWNVYLNAGYPRADTNYCPFFKFKMIDGKRGLEKDMTWYWIKVSMEGRLGGGPSVIGQNVAFKEILEAIEPYDIQGIGTFRIRYKDGRMDDTWAYIRSVRRTRRLSGGAWMDPIGGTDELNDEVSIFSAFPAWYPKYIYLGKRYVLAIAHSKYRAWPAKDSFPTIDMINPPYFNPVNTWEPREVYVVEAIMPKEHPYSRRIYYIDAEAWILHYSESYDKKGEFSKIMVLQNRVSRCLDSPTSASIQEEAGFTIDFKRMHATVFFEGMDMRQNPPGIGPEEASLHTMEAIATGKYRPKMFPEAKIDKSKFSYFKDFNLDWKTLKLK